MVGMFLINAAVRDGDGNGVGDGNGIGDSNGGGSDLGGMIQLMELLTEGEEGGVVVVVLIIPFVYFFEG